MRSVTCGTGTASSAGLTEWSPWSTPPAARGGCPIGTLAAALSDTDERFRVPLSEAFDRWRQAIAGALTRLQERRLLASDADLEALTTTTLAAIQGGLLLAKTSRDSTQLKAALDGAITHLRNS